MSYITLEDATSYLEGELWSDAWMAADEVNQEKALNKATTIIDQIRYKGSKLLSTQDNEFPRDFQESTPQDVTYACALIALKLIEGRIPELDFGNARITSDNLASGKTTYNEYNMPQHLLYGIPSYDAWGKLVKYVDLAKTVSFIRVS